MADDQDTMARTIFGESRGEGYTGMVAVACVIMNRAKAAQAYFSEHGKPHPLFGDGTAASACKMPWQFSCWNSDDPNCEIIENVTSTDPIFTECLHIAEIVLDGAKGDPTYGATYYFDRRSPLPNWAQGKTPCAQINHHVFFNNIV